jgi:putative phosphoribosyl transferase
MGFRDRAEAGRLLAGALRSGAAGPDAPDLHTAGAGAPSASGAGREPPVVLGLPRGGIPVAAEVAGALEAPLDVLVVRKLGYPYQPELGLGAIGEGGVRVVNRHLVQQLGVTPATLEAVARREDVELRRRVDLYRRGRPRIPLDGRDVVVVDDGLATGFTARAGVEIVRRSGARRVVLAVPVAPRATLEAIADAVDELVCVFVPADFSGIGEWYDDFAQVSDDEVHRRLAAP